MVFIYVIVFEIQTWEPHLWSECQHWVLKLSDFKRFHLHILHIWADFLKDFGRRFSGGGKLDFAVVMNTLTKSAAAEVHLTHRLPPYPP